MKYITNLQVSKLQTMDRFIDYSQDKVDLIRKKTVQIQEMLNIKHKVEENLTRLYNEHHKNIHLRRLEKKLVKIKTFQFQDSEDCIRQLREFTCDLNCELLLVSILFYPDVGESCKGIRKMIQEFLL